AQGRDRLVDLGLRDLAVVRVPAEAIAEGGVRLELRLEDGEGEGLDDVLGDTVGQGLLHDLHVPGRGHGDDVHVDTLAADGPADLDPVSVRQIHVEEHEVDALGFETVDLTRQSGHRLSGVLRHSRDVIAVDTIDLLRVSTGSNGPVLDGEHTDTRVGGSRVVHAVSLASARSVAPRCVFQPSHISGTDLSHARPCGTHGPGAGPGLQHSRAWGTHGPGTRAALQHSGPGASCTGPQHATPSRAGTFAGRRMYDFGPDFYILLP